jgi:hypothetical protein
MSTLLLEFFNLITDYDERRPDSERAKNAFPAESRTPGMRRVFGVAFHAFAPPKHDRREAQWCRL